jgi:ubiquinone biosynthesis monooxygenase Coq7
MASALQNSLKRTTASLLQTQSRLTSAAAATAATRALSTTVSTCQATTSTSPPSASDNHNTIPSADSSSTSTDASASVPPLKLSKEQRELLEEMIRVDQAGELGANWIYRGQYAVLGSDKKVGPLLQVLCPLSY